MPATAATGQEVEVVGVGAGGWRIAQNAGQKINFGDLSTATGISGRLDSTHRYDTIKLVCVTNDTEWVVVSSQGNIDVV
jgi:hypothetical protein